ncbi:hypothetical protein J6590_051959 [Homalodisca vitripennis]|nr:hypothetical protein J6590_051959 [Homalodisca vitripennis]
MISARSGRTGPETPGLLQSGNNNAPHRYHPSLHTLPELLRKEHESSAHTSDCNESSATFLFQCSHFLPGKATIVAITPAEYCSEETTPEQIYVTIMALAEYVCHFLPDNRDK